MHLSIVRPIRREQFLYRLADPQPGVPALLRGVRFGAPVAHRGRLASGWKWTVFELEATSDATQRSVERLQPPPTDEKALPRGTGE